MKTVARRSVSVLLTLTMLIMMTAVGGFSLTTSAADGDVLYSENFDSTPNGSLPDGWVVSSPSGVKDVYVEDGALIIKAAGTSDSQTGAVYLGDELKNKGDYIYEADYTILNADVLPLSSSTRYSSMMFRVGGTTSSNGYYPPYYYCTTRVVSRVSDELSIQKSGSAYTQIAKSYQSNNLELNQTYHLKVVCRGANIQFYIDDELVINQTLDTTGSSYAYLTTGSIGVNTSNLTVRFDNIKVTEAEVIETQPALYDTYIPTTDLADAPSVIADVVSSDVLDTVTGTKLPSTTLYYLDSSLNVTTPSGTPIMTLTAALKKTNGKVIPALFVKDQATVDALEKLAIDIGLQDAFLVSDSSAILKYARQALPNLYGAYYYHLSANATESDLKQMVSITNSSLGKTVMTDAKYMTKDDVYYLQQRLMNVWLTGEMDNVEIYNNISKGADGIVVTNHADLMNAIESFNSGTKTLIRTPFKVGHRGYMTQYPQNTIASFRGAIENGADVVETDVRQTKDGVLVLYHDDYLYTLTDCTDQTRTIENTTYEELLQYHVNYNNGSASTEPIATLEDFLTLLRQTNTLGIVEIKNSSDASLVTKTAAMFSSMDITDLVVVIAFDSTQASRMRTALPGVSTGLLANANNNYTTTTSILNWTKNCTVSANTTFHPNTGVIYSGTTLRTELLAASAQRGIHYYAWTYTEQSRFDSSFIGGVQSLTGNYMEFDDDYVRYLTASDSYTIQANQKVSLLATGNCSKGDKTVSCSVKVIEGDDINFTFSAGKVTADKEGVVTALLQYKVTTSAGSYYALSSPVTITVSEGAAGEQYVEKSTNLLPSSASSWVNSTSKMNIDATKNSDGSYTLTNTTGSWPSVDNKFSSAITASVNDQIRYDLTVGGSLNIMLILGDGTDVSIVKAFEGSNSYSGDDLVGNGATFSGVLDLYDCIPESCVDDNGEFTISAVRIYNVGSAGTDVVVRNLELVQQVLPYLSGDVNDDGVVNTSDARMIISYLTDSISFTVKQRQAADYDGSGNVDTIDVRVMLSDLTKAAN